MTKKTNYIVVIETETDGEAYLRTMTAEEIHELDKYLHYTDYAVISGTIKKDFNQRLPELKGE